MDQGGGQAQPVAEVQPVSESPVSSVLDPAEMEKTKVLKQFSSPKRKMKGKVTVALVAVVVILAGVASGWLLTKWQAGAGGSTTGEAGVVGGLVKEGGSNEAGVADESMFPDEAEGELKEGGIDGEGTHYLDRENKLGPGKNVYLFSTVIDLQSFAGKKVQVWGQTVSGQKAGWLMDVGKIKVLE